MKKMDAIPDLLEKISQDNLRHCLFYLSKDPIPCRTLNFTRPGRDMCTLYEADEFIARALTDSGCSVERQKVPVQAFQPDTTAPHGFRKPLESEPWYDSFNLFGVIPGVKVPGEAIVFIAHKDTQSWLTCAPGAYDNCVGVVCLLELARLSRYFKHQRTAIFLFPNEEHWPWTSVAAAESLAKSQIDIIAVINVDGIGGKSTRETEAGKATNVTRYSTAEGERLADLMAVLNETYAIGLEQSKFHCSTPNDDDGSFVNAGFSYSVLNIGSFPYSEPHYHTPEDRPEHVDIENLTKATQLCLAALLHLDASGNDFKAS
ncbi:MAG: M28 family metallopeptidase [Candidatus Zhuqueibacterota bacterium]